MADAHTPSMQQYLKAKAEHPDCVVLFRMGDFYETFFEDAVEVSRLLDIALTSRNKDDPNPVPMAGVPHHSVRSYIGRLLDAGRKVAICEQMEDPRQARGIVRREVVRVITPGILLDTELTDETRANHLVCLARDERGLAVAALDASTGLFRGAVVTGEDAMIAALGRLAPAEVVVAEGADEVIARLARGTGAMVTPLAPATLVPDRLETAAAARVPPDAAPAALRQAAAGVLSYVASTYPALLSTVQAMEPLVIERTLLLPQTTVRNLELTDTMRGRSEGSLFRFLNRTKTGMGGRELRARLLGPLTAIDEIDRRLDRVEALVAEPTVRGGVRDALADVRDVERLLTRLAGGGGCARDLNALAHAVTAAEAAGGLLAGSGRDAVAGILSVPADLAGLATEIAGTFVEAPPSSTKDGGMVRRGVDPDLDEALDLAGNGKRYIAEYEGRERERTGISGLKVRYNRVFGYTIEVTHAHRSKVPADYERRQTLTGVERYTTPELSRLEVQVSTAEERGRAIEAEIFDRFCKAVIERRDGFQSLARAMAEVDVSTSLAEVAHSQGWCRPLVTNGRGMRISGGRHPIVESSLPPGTFVPNDYEMDGETVTLDILTGPNMAGKSTVMRQIALMALLAQMGSFVPASAAEVGVADAVFTRVGAMDELAAGRSTFMVEMSETAEVLARATDRSLVVLDEIGRGTSTFDGVAIAWAVAEYIQSRIGCRTLFATHYHELTDLARSVPRTRNLSIAVKEWGGEVLFLRKLVEGPASKSYGIQVARLAGLPAQVVERARGVLANLEAQALDTVGQPTIAREARGPRPGARARVGAGVAQLDMFGAGETAGPDPVIEKLRRIDPDRLTPIEALQVLSDMVREVMSKGHG